MTLVVDASVVVAGLVDVGPRGVWARQVLGAAGLVSTHVLPAEVTSAVRRLVAQGVLAPELGRTVLEDLDLLPVEPYPFLPFQDRVWQLRENLTAYDAWYVALAEAHDVPLATLDRRLSASPGPRCGFRTPNE